MKASTGLRAEALVYMSNDDPAAVDIEADGSDLGSKSNKLEDLPRSALPADRVYLTSKGAWGLSILRTLRRGTRQAHYGPRLT
jgi:hypothetical protein